MSELIYRTISHREITFTCRITYINKELICNMLGIVGYKRTEILFPKKKKRGSKRRRRKTG